MCPEAYALNALNRFEFTERSFDPDSGLVSLVWHWRGEDATADEPVSIRFEERFQIPGPIELPAQRNDELNAALDLLHWVAGVSYWKARCSGEIEFAGTSPDHWQAEQLSQMYQQGLAELAWRNHLDHPYWPTFPSSKAPTPVDHSKPSSTRPVPWPSNEPSDARALVALGGGKDSLVALERVRARGFEPMTVQVGRSERIRETATAAGTQHRVIRRTIAPTLIALNQTGAINGHIPITAINSAVLVVAAIVWGLNRVVFANERSANTPTLIVEGHEINHQYAKSYAFETMLNQWLEQYISTDLKVFSILRRDSELAVCREFAGYRRYHAVFTSCNRNFHLDGPRTERWCGACPKCLFVYLAMAPFMRPAAMRAIFGTDLLDDLTLLEGFDELLELSGHRPFECVGEAEEARAAVHLLNASEDWQGHRVVRALHQRLRDSNALPDTHQIEQLLTAEGPDQIPTRFIR
ncbi:MAG: endonuclease domain-containing protein [Pseudomonadota bacterium]